MKYVRGMALKATYFNYNKISYQSKLYITRFIWLYNKECDTVMALDLTLDNMLMKDIHS